MFMMAVINLFAQVVGSFALVASLVFVSIQIRTNTKSMQAVSHQAITAALNELNLLWASNSDVATIWLAGLHDRSALSPEDCWRFDSLLRTYLHICETMFMQADLGTGDYSIFKSEEGGIKATFASEGVRAWWRDNPFGFSPSFRLYIKNLVSIT